MPLEQLIAHDDDPGALVVAQQLEHFELLVDVLLRHACQRRDFRNAGRELRRGRGEAKGRMRVQMLRRRGVRRRARRWEARRVGEKFNQHFLPILSVTQQTQVGERFLGRAQLALTLTEFVGEGDQQTAQALSLVLRQGENTSDVVSLGRFLFLAEVPNEMAPVLVPRDHAVEQERVDVVVERLVIQE